MKNNNGLSDLEKKMRYAFEISLVSLVSLLITNYFVCTKIVAL